MQRLHSCFSEGAGEDEEGDYVSGQDDDADDEATLEEEEKMAAAEAGGGEAVAAAEKQEAAGLAEDVDVPLEQLLPPELLARYGLAGSAPGQPDVGLEAGSGGSPSDPESDGGGSPVCLSVQRAWWRPPFMCHRSCKPAGPRVVGSGHDVGWLHGLLVLSMELETRCR